MENSTTPPSERIHFKNTPRLLEHEADQEFNARRLALVPKVERFLEEESLFEGKELSVEFAQTGVSSLVCFVECDGKKYVLKVPLSHTMGEAEALFLKKWEAAGVKTPHVYGDGRLGDHPYLLMEFVEAPVLEDAIAGGTAPETVWRDMGHTLAQMHTTQGSGFGRIANGKPQYDTFEGWLFSDSTQKRVTTIQNQGLLRSEHGPIAKVINMLVAYSEQHPESTFCHFDFTPPNLLATTPLTVIDPDPTLNYGVMDIARTIFNMHCSGFAEQAMRIKEGYFEKAEVDEKVLQAAIVLSAHWKFFFWQKTGREKEMAEAREFLAAGCHLL
ncbi:MAG TPA: aminoglycoside phosphotransferase family protein [Verrucomicrobiae bacterium]|nr:aminoglycoside phosphotransferase family protein [Verrucomicrobiae bacterium]